MGCTVQGHPIMAKATRPTLSATLLPFALRRLALRAVALARSVAHRRAVNDVLRLDDRMLKDIGLVRSDVLGALAGPGTKDPSIDLRLRSVENRLNQTARASGIDRVRPGGGGRRLPDTPVYRRAA
jgi:uncharacterized protein YjiS (DUF1127 family)